MRLRVAALLLAMAAPAAAQPRDTLTIGITIFSPAISPIITSMRGWKTM